MSEISSHFERLSPDNRLFWIELCMSPDNGRNSAIAINVWSEDRGTTHERAAAEFMAWLQITREACGVEGIGHA